MTGYLLACRLLERLRLHVSIARGSPNRYEPREYTIYLESAIHDGTGNEALAVAAHECVHGWQHLRMGAAWLVLLSRLEPFNYWIERSAWKRVLVLLAEELNPSLHDLLEMREMARSCLARDRRQALIQCGVAAAVLLLAWAVRG